MTYGSRTKYITQQTVTYSEPTSYYRDNIEHFQSTEKLSDNKKALFDKITKIHDFKYSIPVYASSFNVTKYLSSTFKIISTLKTSKKQDDTKEKPITATGIVFTLFTVLSIASAVFLAKAHVTFSRTIAGACLGISILAVLGIAAYLCKSTRVDTSMIISSITNEQDIENRAC